MLSLEDLNLFRLPVDWTIVGVVLTAVGLLFAYLQLKRTPRAKGSASSVKTAKIHDETPPRAWQGVLPEGSKVRFTTKKTISLPAAVQTESLLYSPTGHARPLNLKGSLVSAEIQFSCRVNNAHKASFAGNDYAMNFLPAHFLVRARDVLEQYTASTLMESRERIAVEIKERLVEHFNEYGYTLGTVNIGSLEKIGSSEIRTEDKAASKGGQLLIGVYGVQIVQGAEVVLILAIPNKKHHGRFMDIRVTLANIGENDVQNVSVSYKFQRRSFLFLEKEHVEMKHPLFDDEVVQKEDISEEEKTHAIRLDRIHPKTQVEVVEPVKVHESIIESHFMMPAANGKKVKVPYHARMEWFMNVSVLSSDAVPINFKLGIQVYRATSLQKLEQDYIVYLMNKRKEEPLDRVRQTNCVFIMPKYRETVHEKKRVLLECITQGAESSYKLIREDGSRVTVTATSKSAP